MTYVVDASVAIEWVLPEPGREQAAELLSRYESRQVNLIAPQQIVHEVASALSKLARRKEITPKDAETSFRHFKTRQPMLVEDLAPEAFALSVRYQISYWDSLYLALAIEYGAELITADRRFQRSVHQHYPWITLITSNK